MAKTFNSSGKERASRRRSSEQSENLPEEPEVQFFPITYAVPVLLPDASHSSPIVGLDPHSPTTQPITTVTDNPLHECKDCLPVCKVCGVRDNFSKIKDGKHLPQYSSECRSNAQSLGIINLGG